MIDDQLKFARLYDRKVGWPTALDDAARMNASLTPCVYDIGAVAHQPADFGMLAVRKCRRDTVARRQVDQLNATAAEKRITGDEKCVGPLTHQRRKDRIDVLATLCIVDLDLQAHGTSRPWRFPHCALPARRVGCIHKDGDAGNCGDQRAQKFKPLCYQLGCKKVDTRHVAAGPGEADNKTKLDRILARDEYDRHRRCCRFGNDGHLFAGRCDHCDLAANQIGRHLRKPIVLIFGESVDNRDILALDIAGLFQTLAKSAQAFRDGIRRSRIEETNHRYRRGLRVGCRWPCNRRAAEQRDELAATDHSITSSARASSEGGTSRPSALAVLRLMTSSKRVGCSTGMSAGFSPFNIRST